MELVSKSKDAVPGEVYMISEVSHGIGRVMRQGVLHLPGQGIVMGPVPVIACAACIREQTRVLLAGIPPALQQQLGIGEREDAVFLPGSETNHESKDRVKIVATGKIFQLWEFAGQGVTLMLAAEEPRQAEPAQARTRELIAA